MILLFFFIGLEYTFERLKNVFFIWKLGIVDFVLNFIPAFLLGLLFGLSPITSLILASVFYPTSTSIIAKLLTDFKRLASPEAELLIGILIFEDLVSIIILSLLIPLQEMGGLQFEMFLPIFLKLLIVLAVFYTLYRFVLPRLNSWMNAISENESFSFFIIGLVMLIGFLFKEFGISEALGAFLLGVLVPETRIKENIERQFFSLKELSVGVFL